MSDQFAGIEPMIHRSKISVPYTWWAGETASAFFISLRDEMKIRGTRCAGCNRVYIPPRKVCPLCFEENTEWVDVSPEGTVVSYTVARRQLASIPVDKKTPVIWAIIRLDGADTGMLHFLGEVDPSEVKIGMRVRAVFAEKRTGTMRDISHFRPSG